MFNLLGGTKTIIRQGVKINQYHKEFKNMAYKIEKLKKDNKNYMDQIFMAKENNRALRFEKETINNDLKLATNKKVEYRNLLREIKAIVECNTLGNPENTLRKVKSMLANHSEKL